MCPCAVRDSDLACRVLAGVACSALFTIAPTLPGTDLACRADRTQPERVRARAHPPTVRLRKKEEGGEDEEEEEDREALGAEVREDVAAAAGVGEERVEVRGVRRERGSGCTLVDLELLS
eukprot:2689276-Rhodomonas_salina.1